MPNPSENPGNPNAAKGGVLRLWHKLRRQTGTGLDPNTDAAVSDLPGRTPVMQRANRASDR